MKPDTMKTNTFFLMPLFCLLPVCVAHAAPKAVPPAGTVTVGGLPVKVRGGDVIVSGGTDADPAPLYNNDLAPVDLEKYSLTPFVAVLKAYPNAHTVKLFWVEFDGTLGGTGTDVLYDRVKHTVTVNCGYGGGENSMITGQVQFTHVRESVFAAILRAHPSGLSHDDSYVSAVPAADFNNAGDWGGFQFLYQSRYGCRVQVLRARHQMHL